MNPAYLAIAAIIQHAIEFYGKLFAQETFLNEQSLLPTTIGAFVVSASDKTIYHPTLGTLTYALDSKAALFIPVGESTLQEFTTTFIEQLRIYNVSVMYTSLFANAALTRAIEQFTNFSFIHCRKPHPLFQNQVLDWILTHRPHVKLLPLKDVLTYVAFSVPEQLAQPTLIVGDIDKFPAKGHFIAKHTARWVKPNDSMFGKGRIQLLRCISEPSFAEGECETVLNWMFPALPVES